MWTIPWRGFRWGLHGSFLIRVWVCKESDADARYYRTVGNDCQSRQLRNERSAKSQHHEFWKSNTGSSLLCHVKELLCRGQLELTHVLFCSKNLSCSRDLCKNGFLWWIKSLRANRHVSSLPAREEIWRRGRNTNQLLASLCRARILPKRRQESSQLDYERRIPFCYQIKSRTWSTSRIPEGRGSKVKRFYSQWTSNRFGLYWRRWDKAASAKRIEINWTILWIFSVHWARRWQRRWSQNSLIDSEEEVRRDQKDPVRYINNWYKLVQIHTVCCVCTIHSWVFWGETNTLFTYQVHADSSAIKPSLGSILVHNNSRGQRSRQSKIPRGRYRLFHYWPIPR